VYKHDKTDLALMAAMFAVLGVVVSLYAPWSISALIAGVGYIVVVALNYWRHRDR
jgi:hypothetical protein